MPGAHLVKAPLGGGHVAVLRNGSTAPNPTLGTGNPSQQPMAPRRRHPLDDQPRPPGQQHRFVRVLLVGVGVAEGQVEFESGAAGLRPAGVETFRADDGPLDVKDPGGRTREGEGLKGRKG